MLNKIFLMNKKYDSVCIFDADNLVSSNFLNEMNRKLCEGCKVIQGYLDSKNPKDTWITGSYSISFWANNRMAQLAKNNLGISSQLGGTGCCIDTEIIKELGWGATCLTEDLEFTCKLVTNGYKVEFTYDAIVYDEKPLTLPQSWKQRKRWMQGYIDVCHRYFFKLLKKGIKERSLTSIDCAIYTIQPILFILIGITTISSGVQTGIQSYKYICHYQNFSYFGNINIFSMLMFLFGLFLYLYTPILLIIEKNLILKCYYTIL